MVQKSCEHTVAHRVRSARIRLGEHPDYIALDDLLIHGVLPHCPPSGIQWVVRDFPLRLTFAVKRPFSFTR